MLLGFENQNLSRAKQAQSKDPLHSKPAEPAGSEITGYEPFARLFACHHGHQKMAILLCHHLSFSLRLLMPTRRRA